jgi:hypothetical protein
MSAVRIGVLTLIAALTACSATPRMEQRSIPGPRAEWLEHQHRPPAPIQRATAPQDVPQPVVTEPSMPSTHADRYRAPSRSMPTVMSEAATRAYLDRAIEQRRLAQPVTPPTVVIERPVEVTQYPPVYDYDPYWQYRQSPTTRRARSTFPWNTAVGAGLGAIIGHQSGRRDRGAAIGAGIGLLFDLWR